MLVKKVLQDGVAVVVGLGGGAVIMGPPGLIERLDELVVVVSVPVGEDAPLQTAVWTVMVPGAVVTPRHSWSLYERADWDGPVDFQGATYWT